MGAGGDALAVLLDGGLLQEVEVADQVVPFDADAGGGASVGQFLLEDQREEGAEDVAADRGVAGVVDRSGAQLGLRPAEQVFHREQLPVAEHGVERRHAGVGAPAYLGIYRCEPRKATM